jgi:serine/threonine-protein kinase
MFRDNEDRSASQDEAPTISSVGSPDENPGGRSVGTSSDGGEFSPGQVIAGRFRIVGRIGSGGMGDVYRADDHELGTSVALKFLPFELSGDPVRLERLRNEVRLARQIAHPNVCRVYDIGDADGLPFLSMEFIDGEDLASLLRRIGRLPKDKAIELAREICFGVAAAHELGVVHRDLKPANVMIDGRGRARVADFGLASAIDELGGGRDAMAGTPAYMAPEQLRGADATKQTDIYALGLVLYELFTGKRAHDVNTIAGLKDRDSSSAPPTSPSNLVEGMDPAVERVIMHCLEIDPEERPASALAVMAALPGGDPLAAMLKAGEMPSPELVAASGRPGTLTPKRALQLGAIIFIGMAVSMWVWGVPSFGDSVGGILAPEVLAHRADVLLADLGFEFEKVDSAWGFDIDRSVVSRAAPSSDSEWWALLGSEESPVLRFWYRSSPFPIAPWHSSLPGLYIGNVVTPEDPPLTKAGMALARLGPRGALLELRVVPGSHSRASTRTVDEVVRVITEAAGLDPSQIERIEWSGISPMPGEPTVAWRAGSNQPETRPREIVTTLVDGRPTWVRVDDPRVTHEHVQSARAPDRVALVFFIFFVGGAVVAGLNVRTGRWDRRGAARLAVVAFVLCFASDIIGSHHPLSASEEVRGFFASVAYGATRALMTWLLYIAIEPFVRRLHPSSLVSWSRLLAGRVSDPAVGRDVLFGLAVFALQSLAVVISVIVLDISMAGLPVFAFASGDNPLAVASYTAAVIRLPAVTLGSALGFLLIYVVTRWMLGRFNRVALLLLWAAVFLFVFAAYTHPDLRPLAVAVFAAVSATASTYLAVRHGLLAFATFQFIQQVSLQTVVTLDPTDWYFPPTAIFLLLVAVLTVFGIKTSIDQKLFLSRP